MQGKWVSGIIVLAVVAALGAAGMWALTTERSASVTELPEGPSDAPARTRNYADFVLAINKEDGLCRGIERGLREHGLVPSRNEICGVPFPSGDSNFERLRPWQDMAPAEHMDLVKEIFFRSNARVAILNKEKWSSQGKKRYRHAYGEADLMDRLWQESAARIGAFIDAGKVKLQSNRFDADNDGKEEIVYRMTYLTRPMSYEMQADGAQRMVFGRVILAAKHCRTTVPGWDDTTYVYMAERNGKREMLPVQGFGDGASYFLYRGRTYWARDTDVRFMKAERHSRSDSSICHFTPALRDQQ